MSFTNYSPSTELANNLESVTQALVEALVEGDKEAFQEILEGFVKARQISKVVKEMKISRAVIYEAMDKTKNPSLSSLCKIMKAFRNADLKEEIAA
jgi:probable addiction module antidote protein